MSQSISIFWGKFSKIARKVQLPDRNLIRNVSLASIEISFPNVLLVASQCWKFLSNLLKYLIWQILKVILNFSLECYYLENNVGVVDFTKACGLVNFKTREPFRALGLV